MTQNLYISDYGLVNALGVDKPTIYKNLMQGSQKGMQLNKELLIGDDVSSAEETKSESSPAEITVAEVTSVKQSQKLEALSGFPTHLISRNNQLALIAINQIRNEVKELRLKYGAARVAIVVGTSTSGISEGERAMSALLENNEFPNSYDYRQQEIFNLAEFVARELDLTGISLTISTACSSSAKAFKTAREIIQSDMADAAVVGGVDTLCGMTINGFHSLASTSESICVPSSVNRDGINIGEAAALAVLRKDKGTICLLGVGESSDAHHMSAPHPGGEGAIETMKNALLDASIQAEEVDYVNLHGTATPKNDEMEAIAVSTVFGSDTACSSSKAMIGHTLGAAGATEVGLCWLLINEQSSQFAPHVWDNEIDPSIRQLNLVGIGSTHNKVISRCLSNSFAFGGNNVSVLIGTK
ncbi:MAG: beta-ketoacyl-ACP synthase [Kangiellaceae bacterium]